MDATTALELAVSKDEALVSVLDGLTRKPAGDASARPGGDVVTASKVFPARDAVYGSFPDAVDGRLTAVLAGRGIEQPYTHQAEAIGRALAGRHVVTVTPTASGKTLCYNVPVLSAILAEPSSRALYLFPTKALAQDQLAELDGLAEGLRAGGDEVGAYTYDGDTPQDARRAIRSRA